MVILFYMNQIKCWSDSSLTKNAFDSNTNGLQIYMRVYVHYFGRPLCVICHKVATRLSYRRSAFDKQGNYVVVSLLIKEIVVNSALFRSNPNTIPSRLLYMELH